MTLAFVPEKGSSRLAATHLMTRSRTAAGTVSVSVCDLEKSFPVRRNLAQTLRHPLVRCRTRVLHNTTFEVADGELFGILGLNGAGKTTLLKILATLILPDQGTARINGHDLLTEPHAVRKALTMVTADERSLHWRLSGFENLRLFTALHRLPSREVRSRISEVLDTVKLSDTGYKMVGAFSSGMRQRLLLARALLARPRVLLMDEPTRSLDPVSAHEFRRLLRDEIVERHGTTVILATHNSEEAFTYCDRIAVLHSGRVAAIGRARTLAARFGPDVYRIWTPTPRHPLFDSLVRRGLVTAPVAYDDADEGSRVECTVVGGESEAADVLRRLIEARVTVSRFERFASPLSTLIARIVEQHENPPGGRLFDA